MELADEFEKVRPCLHTNNIVEKVAKEEPVSHKYEDNLRPDDRRSGRYRVALQLRPRGEQALRHRGHSLIGRQGRLHRDGLQ